MSQDNEKFTQVTIAELRLAAGISDEEFNEIYRPGYQSSRATSPIFNHEVTLGG